MPNLGPTELIIIVVILLIVFGPGKLSGLGSSLGKSIREFRNATQEPDEEETVEKEVRSTDGKVVEEERREIRRPSVTITEQTERVVPADEAEKENKAV